MSAGALTPAQRTAPPYHSSIRASSSSRSLCRTSLRYRVLSHLAVLLTVAVKATLANKNDVAVEFHLDDTTAALEHDFLSEIRFYIPPDKKDKDGDEKNGDPEQSAAERFQKRILAKADVISYAGSGIVVFKDLTLVFPRYATHFCLSPLPFFVVV